LAEAMLDLLNLPATERWTLGMAARQRIADNYEISDVAQRYLALYRDMLTAKIWA
jgi:glycosyltransferase involved in cell wall biosynthesis